MPIRTAQFFSGVVAGAGNNTIFTVPAGVTWLLKNVRLTNNSNVGELTACLINPATGGFVDLIDGVTLGAQQSVEWAGFVVMLAGDRLRIFSANGTTSGWISGTKMPGVAL